MTAERAVFAATAVLVLVAIALVSAGVVVVAGAGWGCITAGGLVGAGSVGGAVALLRDSERGR